MTDNYATPEWLKFPMFDPCPLNPEFDGLSIEWKEWNFVNPPYSNPLAWVKKAIDESKKGKHSVLLLRLDSSTEWYKLLQEAHAHFFYCGERIKFNGKSPAFSSLLVIL